MGAYEFNRSTYRAITVRLNRVKNADIINHLHNMKSVNQYIIDLIYEDMARTDSNPIYEVVEDNGTRKDVLKGFRQFDQAVAFLYMYVSQFTPTGRVYVVQRFTGILTNGKKIRCGKVIDLNIQSMKEKEENEEC